MNTPYIENEVFLYPSEVFISERPAVVTTILGSCVSVTLFHAPTGTGAINHGVLPECNRVSHCDSGPSECSRYVDCSIRLLLERFRSSGIGWNGLEVKLFGGASMFCPESGFSAGETNVHSAFKTLSDNRLEVAAADTGGCYGRKLIFHTHTGEVLITRNTKTSRTCSQCTNRRLSWTKR